MLFVVVVAIRALPMAAESRLTVTPEMPVSPVSLRPLLFASLKTWLPRLNFRKTPKSSVALSFVAPAARAIVPD